MNGALVEFARSVSGEPAGSSHGFMETPARVLHNGIARERACREVVSMPDGVCFPTARPFWNPGDCRDGRPRFRAFGCDGQTGEGGFEKVPEEAGLIDTDADIFEANHNESNCVGSAVRRGGGPA